MASSIKTIIFDIGGVITQADFSAIYSGFAQRIGILPQIVIDYHNVNFDDLLLGNITMKQFGDAMKDAGGNSNLDYGKIWVEEALKERKINLGLLKYIAKLRKKYRVGTLTNLTSARELVDRETGIYSHFDYAILSCEEHLKKPDPAFYRLALERASATPEEAIFVDDQEKYLAAAENIGIRGVRYGEVRNSRLSEVFGESANIQLFRDFEKLGISVD
jgi:putative hydrolase of the HAD superfamily